MSPTLYLYVVPYLVLNKWCRHFWPAPYLSSLTLKYVQDLFPKYRQRGGQLAIHLGKCNDQTAVHVHLLGYKPRGLGFAVLQLMIRFVRYFINTTTFGYINTLRFI